MMVQKANISHGVWLLDPTPEVLRHFAAEVRAVIPTAEVREFGKPQDVVAALHDNPAPRMFVFDRIGLKPILVESLPEPAIMMRGSSPFTVNALFSHGAYHDPLDQDLIPQARRDHLIDIDVEKGHRSVILQHIEACDRLWDSPRLTQFRDYIATVPDADLPFYPGDDETSLSLFDIYRIIASGGPRAEEYAQIWEMMLSGRSFGEFVEQVHT